MRKNSAIFLTFIAVLAALVGATLIPPNSDIREQPSPASPASGEPTPTDRSTEESQPGRVANAPRRSTEARIFVISEGDESPVSRPWFAPKIDSARTIAATTVIHGDEDGSIDFDSLSSSGSWVVGGSGHIPEEFSGLTAGSILSLQRAALLQVKISTEAQAPLGGALVFASPQSSALSTPLESDSLTSSGCPGSKAPYWARRTGPDGVARFDDMPPGHYFIEVRDSSSFMMSRGGFERASAPGELSVSMEDAYAVVAMAPPSYDLRSWSWQPKRALRLDSSLQRSRTWIRSALEKRFPGAITFVGRPVDIESASSRLVACRAILEGPMGAAIAWPMERIDQTLSPVFLEVLPDQKLRSISIHVTGPSGNRMSLRIRLVSKHLRESGRRDIYYGRTGETLVVPVGEYKLIPETSPTWVEQAFEQASIVLTEDSPPVTEQSIKLDIDYRVLEIDLVWPKDSEAFVNLSMRLPEIRDGITFTNRQRHSGLIQCLVPVGRVRVHADLDPPLRDIDEVIEVLPGDTPIRHVVNLTGV